MKLPTLFCLAVLMALDASRAGAQTVPSPTPLPTPRPTPPAPPFLNVTPDYSAWTITRYTVPGSGSQLADGVVRSVVAAAKPESLTNVTKTGQVRHQVRRLKTGEQEDIWYERGSRITMQSIWKVPLFEGNTSGARLPQGPDFPELSWISAQNFVGTQEYQSAAYFVFETQLTEGSAILAKEYGYKLTSSFNRAYINADTRLPWLHQTGDVLQRYTFLAAPATPLDVPPEYQKMFDAFERRKLDLARKPVAP